MADPIRYYADQHYPAPVTDGLVRRGSSDSDQLAFATREGRVLITFDSDFLALHESGVSHAGIGGCPATKCGIGELIRMLLLLHGVVSADEMHNHVEYL